MKYALFGLIAIALVLGVLLVVTKKDSNITSFEECVAAGNPVMESYPRQCRANGQTFVEEVDDASGENSGAGAMIDGGVELQTEGNLGI